MDTLRLDLRQAIRLLRKSPGFTAVAILSLALGIGANTTIFTVVNGLLMKPLPVARPQETVAVFTSDFGGERFGASSYPDYLDFRERIEAFAGLALYSPEPVALTAENGAEPLYAELATSNYFDVVGRQPPLGRGFVAGEDRARVAVLGHPVWRGRFGGDPGVVGRTITVGGHAFEVVGVAPEGFAGLTRGLAVDLWLPLGAKELLEPGTDDISGRGARRWLLLGRLRRGATARQAQAQFDVVARDLLRAHPDQWRNSRGEGRTITVVPEWRARIHPALLGPVLGFLALLLCMVVLVLLIGCANLANLLLARAATRRREIGVRTALGAGRGRLLRQLLTESVLLAALGGAAGLVLALWGADALMAFRPPLPVPVLLDFGLDLRVLGFTLGLSVLTGVLFGLAPALTASRSDLVGALRDEGSTTTARRSRLRSSLVVGQVAASLFLLVGSGLFLRSLGAARALDLGFDADGVAMVSVDLELGGYDARRGRAVYARILERARAVPGVESATLTRHVPLGLGSSRRSATIEGYAPRPGEDMEVATSSVGPDYFRTLGIPLVRGRGVTEVDVEDAPRVVVVNEAFARRYWPGQDPIGRRFWFGNDATGPAYEVVGVARTGRYFTLGEEPRPFVFTSIMQWYGGSATVLLRGADSPRLLEALRREILEVDRNLPVFDPKTMEQHLGFSLLPARLAASMLGVFGAMALLLAGLGLYGLMAYLVSQRGREMGIRMALGAARDDILRLVVGQGMRLAAMGMAAGLLLAAAATRLVRTLLYGISPTDPLTFVGVTLVLGAVALLACYVPARRASRVDPVVSLRYE